MELTGGYCFCCVTKKETSELRVFLVNNKTMKSLLQIDVLTLCLICMRVARQIDKFLNNILASKLLITNSSSPNSELISSNFRLLIQPLHCLATTPIEIGSFGGNHGVGEGIKTGMKTENIENYNELESSDNFCETEVTNVKTETENVEVQDYESADDAVSIKMDIEEGTFLNCDEKFDENEFEFKSKLLKGESFLVGNEDNEKRPIESNNSNTTLSERCNINEELQIEGFTCQLNKPGNANDDLSMWKTVNLSNEVYVMEEHTEKAKNAQYPTSKYKCESCCEVLNVEELYNKNKEAHMAGQYMAKVCKQCFVLQKNLHDHESTHFVRNPCKGDYLSPEKENESAPQLLAAAFSRLQCPKCPADYKLQSNLNRHMQTKHNEKISLHCSELVPTKTFTSPNLLNHPEKSDVQKNCNHSCTVCEAKYETQEKLNYHVSDHNKESRNEEMGREKVIARKKGNHTAENMLKAIKLHRTGVSIRSVAKQLNIAYPTLRRYVVKNLNVPVADLMDKRLTPNYENRVIFTPPQEEELKSYIVDCALRFYGLTVKDCCKVAYQMAKINKIEVPEGWEKDQMAGKAWFRSFNKRHSNLTRKKPEACSLARATAFNRETVKKFFANLKTAIERHPSFGNGCRIYNLDETSTTTMQKPPKVVALKGKHNLSKVTSGEKGTLVTTCAIVSATGQYLPPVMVFPRKSFKDFMLKGAPPGTLGLAQKSGWMTSELFVEVMKHFIKYTNASPENPALLILDNHQSHLSIEALDLAKSSGVTVLTLHTHTTSKLQPLDVGLNGPFKMFYNNAVDDWFLNHPGTPMTIYNVAECVGAAYPLAMSPVNIAAAFKKCGIFPYNPNIFTDIDFLPSDVTDRPLTPELGMQSYDAEAAKTDSDPTDCEDLEMAPSPTILGPTTENPDESQLLNEPVDSTAQTSSPAVKKPFVKTGKDREIDPISPIITTSAEKKIISPRQFMPPLKAGPRTNARKNRSIIANDTPEKIEIANDRQKARDKKAKVEEVKRSVFTLYKKYEPIRKKPAKRARAKTAVAVTNATKKKKLKREVSSASSSEDDIEEIELFSETDISDCQDSEDENMFPIIS